MAVKVGRQIRIDEDIVGMSTQALEALIWMGNCMIARAEHCGLTAEDIEQLRTRIEMFGAELRRSNVDCEIDTCGENRASGKPWPASTVVFRDGETKPVFVCDCHADGW
jgi:hypothetical protein